MVIGVLALQGAFREHCQTLEKLNIKYKEIRNKGDIQGIDGIILPGGESTAIGKLLRDLEIFNPLKEMIEKGVPVLGTCAGMILLAKKLQDDPTVHLGVMDIVVKRNAYGRQLGSFKTEENFIGISEPIPMVFIRAPYIESVGEGVKILSVVNGNIVAAQERNMLVLSFHPELTEDLHIHEYFYKMCIEYKK